MDIKLSNIIGAPFDNYVLEQLYQRATNSSTDDRTPEQILFLANKTSWARLISSVNITLSGDKLTKYYESLGIPAGNISTNAQSSLAENWILEAGTSKQSNNDTTLREGIGINGAYGLGGTEELGYRPMPGLTSIQIETTGKLGSGRQATINFKVWNMNQLNVIEALYFRLGYSMLLEWGHTQYFKNDKVFQRNGFYGINNPFVSNLDASTIQQTIADQTSQTSGNYGGMLGIVSNFTWAFNQDGGYDCVVRLVGRGAIMDSTRVNQSYQLPSELAKEYQENVDSITAYVEKEAKKIADEAAAKIDPAGSSNITLVPPKDTNALLQAYKDYNFYGKTKTLADFTADYGIPAYTDPDSFKFAGSKTISNVVDYYGKISTEVSAQKTYGGLWLNQPKTGWVQLNTSDASTISSITFDSSLLNEATKYLNFSQTSNKYKNLSSTYFSVNAGGTASPTLAAIGTAFLASPATNAIGNAILDPGTTVTYNFPNDVYVKISFNISDAARDFRPTVDDLSKALDDWQTQGSTLTGVEVTGTGNNKVEITGNFTSKIEVTYNGVKDPKLKALAISENGGKNIKTVEIPWTVITNNPGFISAVNPSAPKQIATKQPSETPNSGDTDGQANQASISATTSPDGYESALQAMLVFIQTKCQSAALKTEEVLEVDIKADTELFYKGGVLDGVFKTSTTDPEKLPYDLIPYAQKGFNSNLMVSKAYRATPFVSFDNLCKAYVIKYKQGSKEGTSAMVNSPTYIQLGYLLAFINNMCLIYDSTQPATTVNQNTSTKKQPYIFIDFNPETNFCLTSPQQFSIDPSVCMVPLNATDDQYASIYPVGIKPSPIFKPESQNRVTAILNSTTLRYKNTGNQGRTMNILINIQYLLDTLKQYANLDPQHAVNLQPFLEKIMTDVNKSMGNINLFRVGYRDDTNTVQILDDQWVDPVAEKTILNVDTYASNLKNEPIKSGLLPIFSVNSPEVSVIGTNSMVRQFQFKTTLSTKLSNLIAVSAMAEATSVNAKDQSELSHLNQNFQDRFKPYVQNASNGEAGTNTNTKSKVDGASSDQKTAQLFDDYVSTIYSQVSEFSTDRTELAKNYYIERMSQVKAADPLTSAAPFIPANLEMVIDGISGIIMMQAFTIPENRLPLSLRGEIKDGRVLPKVAFIVVGLTHTIENNQWLTKIRGQLIKLRSGIAPAVAALSGKQVTTTRINTSTATFNDIINKVPWSAAFISYVMKTAGVNFPVSSNHLTYAQSLRGNKNGFTVLDTATNKVKVGDLIVTGRNGNKVSFSASSWSGDGHGDIIVSIDGNTALKIGGNEGDKVNKTSSSLTADGRLGKSDFFVILRPDPSFVKSIVDVAETEYKNWKDSKWTEQTPAARTTIASYYKIVGINI